MRAVRASADSTGVSAISAATPARPTSAAAAPRLAEPVGVDDQRVARAQKRVRGGVGRLAVPADGRAAGFDDVHRARWAHDERLGMRRRDADELKAAIDRPERAQVYGAEVLQVVLLPAEEHRPVEQLDDLDRIVHRERGRADGVAGQGGHRRGVRSLAAHVAHAEHPTAAGASNTS